MTHETTHMKDVINEVLRFELQSKAQGRPIQVVSDFDETQASLYVFSKKWDTHVPNIRRNLSIEAKRLVRPLLLATARSAHESVSWIMWHKLSRVPMPFVAENGAVLVWPAKRISEEPNIEVLATETQIHAVREIEKELHGSLVEKLVVPTGHEIIVRSGRIASIEIRSQNKTTKRGTPEDYEQMTEQLRTVFPEALPFIDIVSTGSSLGIQPAGINKEFGIRSALGRMGTSVEDLFFVGLGDNTNDEPLFSFVKQQGGIAIGVRKSAGTMCDFVFDGGDDVSLQVLTLINSLAV